MYFLRLIINHAAFWISDMTQVISHVTIGRIFAMLCPSSLLVVVPLYTSANQLQIYHCQITIVLKFA
jgi:hypothetical protein